MATIIYSNMGDEDCKCLTNIWAGIDNVKVVEVRYASTITREEIDKAIMEEEDLLICCGHGSPSGLFGLNHSLPDGYAFGVKQMPLVRAKNFFGMWCHASDFAKWNGMKGFFTSMFISNPSEARCNGIFNTTQEYVNEATIRFCKKVNELIKQGVGVEGWRDELMKVMDAGNQVDVFNYNGLYMSDGTIVPRPVYSRDSYLDYFENYAEESGESDLSELCDEYIEDIELEMEYLNQSCREKIGQCLSKYNKHLVFQNDLRPDAQIKYANYYDADGKNHDTCGEVTEMWYEEGDVFVRLSGHEEPFLYEDLVMNPVDVLTSLKDALEG